MHGISADQFVSLVRDVYARLAVSWCEYLYSMMFTSQFSKYWGNNILSKLRIFSIARNLHQFCGTLFVFRHANKRQ